MKVCRAERERKKSSVEKERWMMREASADEMQTGYLSTIQIFEYCRVGQTKIKGQVGESGKRETHAEAHADETQSREKQCCSIKLPRNG